MHADAERVPRVLVVDDDEAFRALVRHALEEKGLSVEEAADGRQALDTLREAGRRGEHARFAAVVTDFQMPRMTGLQLVELLAGAGVAQQTVLLSAFLDRDSEKWARLLGVGAVLSKPLNFSQLADTVQRVATTHHAIKPRQTRR